LQKKTEERKTHTMMARSLRFAGVLAVVVGAAVTQAQTNTFGMDLDPTTEAVEDKYSKSVEATGSVFSTYDYEPVLKAFDVSGNIDSSFAGEILVEYTLTFDEEQDIEFGDGVTMNREITIDQKYTFDKYARGKIEVRLAQLLFDGRPDALTHKTGVLSINIRGPDYFTATSLLTLQHGVAASAVLSTEVSNAESGSSIPVVVTVSDKFGNLCSSYANTQAGKLSSSASSSVKFSKNLSVRDGVAKVDVTNPKAETVNMTLTYTGLTVTGSPLSIFWTAGQTFAFDFGDFAELGRVKLANSFQQIPFAPADTSVEVVVTALDIAGNVDTTENRRVGITFTCDFDGTLCDPAKQKITSAITSTSNSNQVVAFVNGVCKFTMTSTEAHEQLEIGFVAVEAFRSPVPSFNGRQTIRFVENCDGTLTYQNVPGTVQCNNVSAVCAAGSYQIYGSNKTFDRKCGTCDGINDFQDLADQSSCHAMGPTCTVGTFTSIAASPTTNRSCTACDGALTFQNKANQDTCKNATICQPGQFVVEDATPSTDRECNACPKGTADLDEDPTTTCDACSPALTATASFNNDAIVVQFQDNGTVVHISLTSGSTLTSWSVGAGQCTWNAELSVYAPTGLLDNGDLTGKHGVLSSSKTVYDSDLSLWGKNSLSQRGLYIQEGQFSGCANIEWIDAPTFSSTKGNVNCTTVSECVAGEEELLPFKPTQDRTCKACNGATEYQDDGGQRYCKDVKTCDFAPGFRQATAPNATHDRDCEPVTCQGLSAPAFGFVSEPCNSTNELEAFGTVCHYSCDKDNSFLMAPLVGEQAMSRTCMQEGAFNYEPPTCVCTPGLFLDPLAKVCVSVCGTGTFNSADDEGDKKCDICDAACAEGEYESVGCTPYTNRVCTKCSSCEEGTFNSGGCFAHNTTDTICAEHTQCAAGSFEVAVGTTTEDRKCESCQACPSTSFASSGCCSTIETYCDSLSSCIPGVEFEAFAPLDAPQGGFASDRHCRPYTKCGTGEFYASFGNGTDDRECEVCTTCPYGQTSTSDCVQGSLNSKVLGSDTVCSPWVSCQSNEYYTQKPTAYSDGVCGTCKSCQAGEFASGGCDGVEDTVCTVQTVCDPDLQFETAPASATLDRSCQDCQVCNTTTHRLTASCSTNADAVCSTDLNFDPATDQLVCQRGEVYIGTPPNHACIECDECDAGTFAKGGEACRGSNTFNDPECDPWSTCQQGTFQAAAPTAVSDRVCQTCTACAYGYLYVSGCNITHDTLCKPQRTCEDILGVPGYEVIAGTADKEHVCTACRTCPYESGDFTTQWQRRGQFASGGCNGQEDTVCSTFTECSQNEFVVKRGTATSDNVCEECSTKSLGRRGQNKGPFTCPQLADDLCPADWITTTTEPATAPNFHYLSASVTFGGDYDAVVVDSPQRKPIFEGAANEAVQDYMSSLTTKNVTVENLEVTKGSIVVSFDVISSDNDAITLLKEQLEDQRIAWRGLDFVFEGFDMTVVTSSLAIRSTSTATTSTVSTSKTTTTSTKTTKTTTPEAVTTTETPHTHANISVVESKVAVEAAGFGAGGIVGVLFGAIAIILFVAFLVIRRRDQEDQIGGLSPLARKASTTSIAALDDGYLGVSGEAESADLFGNDVADENRRLRSEVDDMRTKIAEKDAIANLQSSSQKSAESAMDNAIAQRIKVENSAIAKEVATLQSELKKKQKATKFQQEAAKQVNLVAQKRQLEEEIRRANEIEQVAIQAIADFDIAGAEDI